MVLAPLHEERPPGRLRYTNFNVQARAGRSGGESAPSTASDSAGQASWNRSAASSFDCASCCCSTNCRYWGPWFARPEANSEYCCRVSVRARRLARGRRLRGRLGRSLGLGLRVILGQHSRGREQGDTDKLLHLLFSLSGRDIQNLRLAPLRTCAAVSFRPLIECELLALGFGARDAGAESESAFMLLIATGARDCASHISERGA